MTTLITAVKETRSNDESKISPYTKDTEILPSLTRRLNFASDC